MAARRLARDWTASGTAHIAALPALAEHRKGSFGGCLSLPATTGRFNLVGQMVLRHYGGLYGHTTDVVGALPGLRAADVTLQVTTLKSAWTTISASRISASRSAPWSMHE